MGANLGCESCKRKYHHECGYIRGCLMVTNHTYSKSVCWLCLKINDIETGVKLVKQLFGFQNPIIPNAKPPQKPEPKRQLKPKPSPVARAPERIQPVRQCRILNSIDQNKKPQQIRTRRITINLPSELTPPPTPGGAIPKVPRTQATGVAKRIQDRRATIHFSTYGNRACAAGSTAKGDTNAVIRSPQAKDDTSPKTPRAIAQSAMKPTPLQKTTMASKLTPPPPSTGAIPKVPRTQTAGAAKRIQDRRKTVHFSTYSNRACAAGSTAIGESTAVLPPPLAEGGTSLKTPRAIAQSAIKQPPPQTTTMQRLITFEEQLEGAASGAATDTTGDGEGNNDGKI